MLAKARSEHRILVTLDKDFGDLVFRDLKQAPPGVILFRLDGASAADDTRRVVSVLQSNLTWVGHFSVVTSKSVRMRPLGRTRGRPR